MKLLTIAIPTYNGEKHLLNNFEKSHIDCDDVEYLIVDDGSKDKTLEVANSFAKKYKNVRVYHQENKGFGGAYNTIFKEVKSTHFYILDCDDYLDTNSLINDIKVIKSLEKENIDVYLNHFVYENQNGKTFEDGIEKFIEPNKISTVKNIKRFTTYGYFMNHNLIVKTELIKRHNLILPLCHYCDNQFIAYILMYADKYYFIDEVLCHYQIGTSDQSVSNLSMARNYIHHLKTLEATCEMIGEKEYKSMKTQHQRNLVLHYVFYIAFLALFSTYLFYNSDRDKIYKSYISKIKEGNAFIYNKIKIYTKYRYTKFVPKHIMGRFFLFGKRKFAKDIPWDY